MSEITGASVGHEEYSFACARCGYGWEQAYDIEHRLDANGQEFIVYRTEGARVPSPLSDLACPNCERRGAVRILRSGQVSTAMRMMDTEQPRAAAPVPPKKAPPARTGEAPGPVQEHHRHLSDLLHPFRDRK
ncbi:MULTISPECIES: hypothetical protein [Streptomyces]|uniref:Uncharacterized protein n=1 Tax=Streptomyces solicathayae TaxID=3081768 RepID=A0ABZ0LXN1_9ACTN|nr:hypothetical protein [Streptomyces sp. HUAS YS2]WOX23916.1 hypothetical protein R2D22_22015 [Streptomyces sp. HUAS YS2]